MPEIESQYSEPTVNHSQWIELQPLYHQQSFAPGLPVGPTFSQLSETAAGQAILSGQTGPSSSEISKQGEPDPIIEGVDLEKYSKKKLFGPINSFLKKRLIVIFCEIRKKRLLTVAATAI